MVTQTQIRRICLALKITRTVLVLAVPVSVSLLWASAPSPPVLLDNEVDATPVDTSQETEIHDLSWYAPLWQRDLKQPPIPAVVAELRAKPRPKPGPMPTLVATLVEPQARYAHFVDRSGKVELKGIDEFINEFRVRAIEPGRVQLQEGERVVWIEIPKRGDRK